MSPHRSDQMSQWSQVSRIALCMAKVKVTDWVSDWVSEWQGHLLSCSGQLKNYCLCLVRQTSFHNIWILKAGLSQKPMTLFQIICYLYRVGIKNQITVRKITTNVYFNFHITGRFKCNTIRILTKDTYDKGTNVHLAYYAYTSSTYLQIQFYCQKSLKFMVVMVILYLHKQEPTTDI